MTAACLLGAAMLPAGCSTTTNLVGKLPGPFGQSARDDQLRQKLEADHFPDAKQVGL